MCFSTVEVVNLPAAAAAGGTARLAPMWQGAGRFATEQLRECNVTRHQWLLQKVVTNPETARYLIYVALRATTRTVSVSVTVSAKRGTE